MIYLSSDQFVFIYLLVFLAGIFVVWVTYEMIRRSRDKHLTQYHLQCRLCGVEFEDRTSVELPRCPHCGNFNERLKKQLF